MLRIWYSVVVTVTSLDINMLSLSELNYMRTWLQA